MPKVYKDQLFAVRNLLSKHAPVERDMLLNLSQKPGLTARQIEAYLVATQLASRRERLPEPVPEAPSELDLSAYRLAWPLDWPGGDPWACLNRLPPSTVACT